MTIAAGERTGLKSGSAREAKIRPEITALRALAVCAVVVFHYWPHLLPGGFIGVDVFFVVSGYVVSAAYLDALLTRSMSLPEFFWRRIRRLMPAAALMLLAVTIAGTVLLEPNELMKLGVAVGAQVVYLQNVLFLVEGDYFAEAMSRPLLHTWSLAVEEQFYVFFALVAFLSSRARHQHVPLFGILFFCSILGSFAAAAVSPKVSFFLLPTRMWELLAGVLCFRLSNVHACVVFFGRRDVRRVIKILALGGFAAACLAFDDKARFPGPQAVLACASTVCFLLALEPAGLKVPEWRLVTWLGDRSFALYLWHWPVLSITWMAHGPLGDGELILLLLSSVSLAAISYHVVEDPIRRHRRLRRAEVLKRAAAGAAVLLIALGAILFVGRGFPSRFPSPADRLFADAIEVNHGRCGVLFRIAHPASPACLVSPHPEQEGVLVVGDSHADAIDEALARAATNRGRAVYLADTSCDFWKLRGAVFRCGDSYRRRLVEFAHSHDIRTVLFVSAWKDFKSEANAITVLQAFVDDGFAVHVSGPMPFGPELDPAARARHFMAGQPDVAYTSAVHDSRTGNARRFVEGLSSAVPGVRLAWPDHFLCRSTGCDVETAGQSNFYDEGHLTLVGAERVLPAYIPVFGG